MDKARLLNVSRIVVALAVLIAVAFALARNWDAVSADLTRIGAGPMLASFVLALASPIFTLLGWRVLLADLGTRLPLPAGASVFFVGQLGKYVPGSVWSVVAQADMGSRLGVPRRRMGVVGLLSIGLAVITGAIVGIPAIPMLLARGGDQISMWWAVPAVVAAIAMLWPRLLNTLITRGLALVRREPLEHPLSGRAIAWTSLWFVLAWIAAGWSVLVLAQAVGTTGSTTSLLLASLTGYALAAAIGMFSIFVPAGVGVRDGVLAILLTAVMPLSAATAVVVASRFLTIVVDVVVAAFGWIWGRTHHLLGSSS